MQGVDQRSPVVMTRAGLEDEIVILAAVIAAAVSVAAVPAHVVVANLLGLHSRVEERGRCRKHSLIDEVGGMWGSTAAGCGEGVIPNC